MQKYQRDFIEFLVQSGALTFGDFVTKSGRNTPYFINTGNFNTGEKIDQLGKYYAKHIVESGLSDLNIVFGPAYKGIPLSVISAAALAREHDIKVGFSFDRKEIKDHGDCGKLVGHKINPGDKILIVEDVITAGTTIREVVPYLKSLGSVDIKGIVISVNRCEKGTSQISAVAEVEQSMGIKVFPIVDIHQIVEHLKAENDSGLVLNSEMLDKIAKYLEQYGAA